MHSETDKTWTIAEAKARLSEILRLAKKEGPQRIGTRNSYVIVPEEQWLKCMSPRQPLGQWLVDNCPRDVELELPSREEPPRTLLFGGETGE